VLLHNSDNSIAPNIWLLPREGDIFCIKKVHDDNAYLLLFQYF
jgi:hypothetical protein